MRSTKLLELTHKYPVSEIYRIFSLFRNGRFKHFLDKSNSTCFECESGLLDSKKPKKRIQKMELNIVGAGL